MLMDSRSFDFFQDRFRGNDRTEYRMLNNEQGTPK